MKDVNWPLRKKYTTALDNLAVGAITVPLYYLAAPETETGKYYMTLNRVSNVDVSTKNSADTNTAMQVQIHTWDDNGNAGKLADDIAGAVLAVVYPNSQATMDLSADNLQMLSTFLDGDEVNELSDHGNRVYVTRILTFRHNIYHK